MIPVSDLRKGNLVQTEHGILPVQHLSFSDVYVMGKGGRTLHAKQVEGIQISIYDISTCLRGYLDSNKPFVWTHIKFLHQLQNYFYWNTMKELELGLGWYNEKHHTKYPPVIEPELFYDLEQILKDIE